MAFDTIIQGGTLITPGGELQADLAIHGEKIAAIGEDLATLSPGAAIINAREHIVLPGALDVHVHLDLPCGAVTTSDDWLSGTRAAARGGVTTVIDFATPVPLNDGSGRHESLTEAADHWHRRAAGKAIVDYAYHMTITNWPQHKKELKSIIQRGFNTFKEYMVYQERHLGSDDQALFATLEAMRDHGTRLHLHAESAGPLREYTQRYHTREMIRRFGARLHTMTRPHIVETEAIQRAINFCRATGGPLYIVHTSTGEGAELIAEAQSQGVPVVAETCAQYLVLDDSVFERPDGHMYACSPQVKTPADRDRLWAGLLGGEISTIATDTCTFTQKQKARWKGDWTKLPNGLPGLETLVPLVYTHGVLGGRLTLSDMAQKLAENPAKLMGLYPKKGALAVGSDADLAIIHPTKKIRVNPAKLEHNTDWSPYTGWELAGFARTTLSRGEVIVDNYKVTAQPGRGQWLFRQPMGGTL
jgi:dihydropyrimidinase